MIILGGRIKPIIIGIAGASGSGKTLLAKSINKDLGSDQVAVILEDSYYKDLGDMPKLLRDKLNFDHPDALDHDLFIQQLKELQSGQSINIPIYDYASHSRLKNTKEMEPHRIIVLDGILLFSDKQLRDLMDIKIFIDTPLDICLMRRIRRDTEDRGRSLDSILSQYEKTVKPMYLQFIEPSKRYADIIVPRGGKNRIAIDMIRAKMKELLVD